MTSLFCYSRTKASLSCRASYNSYISYPHPYFFSSVTFRLLDCKPGRGEWGWGSLDGIRAAPTPWCRVFSITHLLFTPLFTLFWHMLGSHTLFLLMSYTVYSIFITYTSTFSHHTFFFFHFNFGTNLGILISHLDTSITICYPCQHTALTFFGFDFQSHTFGLTMCG